MVVGGNDIGLATFELYERAIKDAENIKDIDAGKDRYTLSEKMLKKLINSLEILKFFVLMVIIVRGRY